MPAQRVHPPRHASDCHQRSAEERRRSHSRRHQVDEPRDCQGQTDSCNMTEPLTRAQADAVHRQLNRAEQNQRARPDGQGEIGEGEKRDIGKQHDRSESVGMDRRGPLRPEPHDERA